MTDAGLIHRMVLRAAHCRELAEWLSDRRASKILEQMADEIEADIKRVRAQSVERPAIPLNPDKALSARPTSVPLQAKWQLSTHSCH